MNSEKKYILPLLIAVITASVSSCASNPNANNRSSETPAPTATANSAPVDTIPTVVSSATPSSEAPEISNTPSPTPSPSVAKLREKTREESQDKNKPSTSNSSKIGVSYSAIPSTAQTPTGKTTEVTVYTSDTQCQELVPQKIPVSAQAPVVGAVGKVLEGRDNGDFSLSGYRVNVNNGIATVDLRLSPNSKRILTSLSSCEQFALFGSLRKTLTSNSQWKIKDVRFTEKGEEIAL
ncbi:hypothetical protein [Calothrix sp. UHCC 0171]|uniref:hypothetical protein n=1 Tax=Calothrix sp. UHCC 0171 TaxID=3110245 RepID=UPI002B21A16E|nr:hypothetical protein [Calothrix sp. UHCC 0171]MEA5571247.1 hypothetical protein [Calothrix sp. UHCC 0171]